MTPQEKANELIDKFIPFTKDWDELNGWMDNVNNAKECALIAVDEMLRAAFYSRDEIYNFYIQVKQEIQKI